MSSKVPKPIKEVMDRYGMNNAYKFVVEGVTFYSLSFRADDGTSMPTGLPIMAYIKDNKAVVADDDQALHLISQIEEEE